MIGHCKNPFFPTLSQVPQPQQGPRRHTAKLHPPLHRFLYSQGTPFCPVVVKQFIPMARPDGISVVPQQAFHSGKYHRSPKVHHKRVGLIGIDIRQRIIIESRPKGIGQVTPRKHTVASGIIRQTLGKDKLLG